MSVRNICSKYLCDSIKNALEKCNVERAEEIRLRVGQAIITRYNGGEEALGYRVTKEDIKEVYSRLIQYSPFAFREEINSGYVTVEGGYRVGIAGTVIEDSEGVRNIKNISSLNIRIAREIKNCAESFVKYIKGNTIIISPPAVGKTTMLRDIIRIWSNSGKNIAVIDERNEISGTYMGVSQLDLGQRTDIIVNVSKNKGFEMALRSLGPEVIAVDEIGGREDRLALINAMNCGVDILCTVHCNCEKDLRLKRGIDELVEDKFFDTYIFMNKACRKRVEKICNREMNVIWQEKF